MKKVINVPYSPVGQSSHHAQRLRRYPVPMLATVTFAVACGQPCCRIGRPGGRSNWSPCFPPGGSVDQVARILTVSLQAQLGQTVIVETRAALRVQSVQLAGVAQAPADGYTFAVVFDSHAVNPALIPRSAVRYQGSRSRVADRHRRR